MVGFFLLFISLLAPSGMAGECESPTDCGISEVEVPDFELVDQNPASPTLGRVYLQDDFLGKVFVIYWASAT